jgi:hypothetical protein
MTPRHLRAGWVAGWMQGGLLPATRPPPGTSAACMGQDMGPPFCLSLRAPQRHPARCCTRCMSVTHLQRWQEQEAGSHSVEVEHVTCRA